MKKLGVDGILRRTAVGDTLDVIAAMVASGRYVGFLPDRYVNEMPIGADMRKILPQNFSYNVDIAVVHRTGVESRKLDGFIASIFDDPDTGPQTKAA